MLEREEVNLDQTSARCILQGLLKYDNTPNYLKFNAIFKSQPALQAAALDADLSFYFRQKDFDSLNATLLEMQQYGISIDEDRFLELFNAIDDQIAELFTKMIIIEMRFPEDLLSDFRNSWKEFLNLKSESEYTKRDLFIELFFRYTFQEDGDNTTFFEHSQQLYENPESSSHKLSDEEKELLKVFKTQ